MRRLDYVLVAQTLAQALNECRREPVSGVVLTIQQFADVLYIDNKNFSKEQFIDNIMLYTVNERGQRALEVLKAQLAPESVKVF
jgi:Glu-tRNA(Gln) amidotransferase subunit E-like FAD-binding protein